MSEYQPTPPPSAPYASGGYGAPQRYNVLSIVGFILSFIVSIAGLIVSIIAFRQIKRTGEQGRGLAIAGIIISAVGLLLGVIYVIVIIAVVASGVAGHTAGAYGS